MIASQQASDPDAPMERPADDASLESEDTVLDRVKAFAAGESPPLALVTGATGYVGGRLVPRLLEAGFRVRCLVRSRPGRLDGRPWREAVEVAVGDVLEEGSLDTALAGVDVAYYLIHGMSRSGDFRDRDVRAGRHFAGAAQRAGVGRIVYLGGLGDPAADLSEHLASRHETGDALREAGVPVTELRAAVIVGSGSISFEMVRYLVERVPTMIMPKWVSTRIQPIAVRDVLSYLVAAASEPKARGRIVEIGGADVLTYRRMMEIYADERNLPRLMLPVPVLTPRLSSLWVHLVTPIPSEIARPLIEGVRNEVIVRDDEARRIFPTIEPIGYRQAVQLALARLDADEVETSWSDAIASARGDARPVMLADEEGMLLEHRERWVNAPPALVYQAFSTIGGATGWYANGLWRLRGVLDRLVGGPGFRRGRRDADELRVGDAVDFWRVEAVEPGRRLLLRAEMKLPGDGWLEFRAETDPEGAEPAQAEGRTLLSQTAYFAPRGLSGLLYWYTVYPLHGPIFSGMIDWLAARAEALVPAPRSR
jgi:uncharacterized protein YbjT (DUF2867 family)